METVTSGCSGDMSIRLNSQGEICRELNSLGKIKMQTDDGYKKEVLGAGKIAQCLPHKPEDLT